MYLSTRLQQNPYAMDMEVCLGNGLVSRSHSACLTGCLLKTRLQHRSHLIRCNPPCIGTECSCNTSETRLGLEGLDHASIRERPGQRL